MNYPPYPGITPECPARELDIPECVPATVKHFVSNNQELDRLRVSFNVSELALREIYLPAFKAAVLEGNVQCVMSSYNLVNRTPPQ